MHRTAVVIIIGNEIAAPRSFAAATAFFALKITLWRPEINIFSCLAFNGIIAAAIAWLLRGHLRAQGFKEVQLIALGRP